MSVKDEAIALAVDDTDHFIGICPLCDSTLLVLDMVTQEVEFQEEGNKCTRVVFWCAHCEFRGHRKIYWRPTMIPRKYFWRTNKPQDRNDSVDDTDIPSAGDDSQ